MAFQLISHKDNIAEVSFDFPNEKVNKLSSQSLPALKKMLEDLQKSNFKFVLFTSAKKKSFVVGADIDEIRKFTTKDQYDNAVNVGQSVFNLIEDLPMPTMAVINGVCVGGGCEMVMACDYRMISEDESARIGLPEIKLGIIPGFGGCLRMPRILGLQAALDIILSGKIVAPKKALKAGLVDWMVHPDQLREQALRMASEIVKKNSGKRKKTFSPKGMMAQVLESGLGRMLVFKKAKEAVLKETKGFYPAPLKALEVIQKTYGQDRAKSLEIERAAFCEVAVTAVSKNLIHVFDLTERVKKNVTLTQSSAKAQNVSSMGILGAGTMGGGIAYVAADKGIRIQMKDLNFEALGKGLKHAQDLWMKLVKKRVINDYDFRHKMALVSAGVDYAGFKTLDVVVEAIVEDMEIKKKVIAETASKMKPDGIIVTNTSSLSVNEMQIAHPHPEFFAGMHFFNPVHKMPLVEVIQGQKTSDQTVMTIYELSKKMGKMPVVVKDGPGFLVNRLLLPYMGEAAYLLQDGMSIEQVDRMYTKTFGMPMGPFALMDEVGLDVCIKVLKIFKKAFGDRIQMAPCMEKLATTGRLGKKNSKGFYLYSSDRNVKPAVDPVIYAELGLPQPTNPLAETECLERGIFAMINECSRALLTDKIVDHPHEVDLAMIMGTGFPPFRGGLLRYADSLGVKYIAGQLEKYSQKARRLKPAPELLEINKFYR